MLFREIYKLRCAAQFRNEIVNLYIPYSLIKCCSNILLEYLHKCSVPKKCTRIENTLVSQYPKYFFLFLLKNINCGYSLEPTRYLVPGFTCKQHA